jgi:hypothetical protein
MFLKPTEKIARDTDYCCLLEITFLFAKDYEMKKTDVIIQNKMSRSFQ